MYPVRTSMRSLLPLRLSPSTPQGNVYAHKQALPVFEDHPFPPLFEAQAVTARSNYPTVVKGTITDAMNAQSRFAGPKGPDHFLMLASSASLAKQLLAFPSSSKHVPAACSCFLSTLTDISIQVLRPLPSQLDILSNNPQYRPNPSSVPLHSKDALPLLKII
jgi:hypothetical protein